MEWFSTEESITKPECFAPRDLGFVKLAIVVFSSRIYDWMKSVALSELAIEKDRGIIGARRFFATKDGLGVFQSYIGAPVAVSLLEILIAAGIRRFLVLSEAGSLNPIARIGELIVPTFAIREEGSSYHYLPLSVVAKPSLDLLKSIKELLSKVGIPFKEGGVWTTDAPFRETPSKVHAYSKIGVLAVDMECSAIFSLSIYRKVESAALLVITDTLWEGVWKPGFEDPRVVSVEKRVSESLVMYRREL